MRKRSTTPSGEYRGSFVSEYGAPGEGDSGSEEDGQIVYKEISMPACDRAMLLCLVIVALTILGVTVATFVKTNEAFNAITQGP